MALLLVCQKRHILDVTWSLQNRDCATDSDVPEGGQHMFQVDSLASLPMLHRVLCLTCAIIAGEREKVCEACALCRIAPTEAHIRSAKCSNIVCDFCHKLLLLCAQTTRCRFVICVVAYIIH